MRRSTRGVFPMNFVLSMSFDPTTDMTCGVLLTCSDKQTAFIGEELKRLRPLAGYPLLLPILLIAHQRRLLQQEEKYLWRKLLLVEVMSGQTGVPVVLRQPVAASAGGDYDSIIKGAMKVIQLAAARTTYTEVLLLGADAIQETSRHILSKIPRAQLDYMEAAESAMTEYLGLTTHRCKVLLSDYQYIYKRGQAQMTAIYNYIAKQDTQSSIDISTSTRQIAAASQRDSSAMKGLALLTMVFLPGTFAATFLALPLFDFNSSSGTPTVKTGFWIYWAITIPLTSLVIAAYLLYAARFERKKRHEDYKIVHVTSEEK